MIHWGDSPEMVGSSEMKLGKTLYMVILQVSWDRDLFLSAELHSGWDSILWISQVVLLAMVWNGRQIESDI